MIWVKKRKILQKMDERQRELATSSLFAGLRSEQLERIAEVSARYSYARGADVFSEGDDADGFYVILAGQVRVYKMNLEGKEQILHLLGPGDPVGEAAVFSGGVFPAHAAALTNAELLFVPKKDFEKLLLEDPSISMNMLALLSKRLHRFAALIEDLALKEVPARLAAYLLYHAETGKQEAMIVSLGITKGQLANVLGTTPETLSRVLARMGKEGLIVMKGNRRIVLHDAERLETLSTGNEPLT